MLIHDGSVATKYVDPGVTVVGGTVISVSGSVDTSRVGKYTLTYTISFGSGNTTTIKRTVIVAPTLEKVKLVNNTLTIKVGSKNVVLRPFIGYRGAVLARKAVVDRKSNPMYFFVATEKMGSPSLVVYNSSGKLLIRQALKTISVGGLQVEVVANPASLSIYLAVAAKTSGLSVSFYNISKSGFKAFNRLTTNSGKGTLLFKWLKTYADEYGLVSLVKNTTGSPRVWRYSTSKKIFLRDTKYDLNKLKWTKISVGLK